VGFFGAVVGNATAIGGGIVFLPAMVLWFGLPPVEALQLSLASQAFGMSSGALGWLRRRAVPLAALRWTLPAVLLGATASVVAARPSGALVKALFGPASIVFGLLVLVELRRRRVRDDLPSAALVASAAGAAVGGLVTGWVAIGAGEVVSALLMLLFGVRAERAIALGVVLLAVSSIHLTVLHTLVIGGVPWEMAAFTILGCVFGARLAPWLCQFLSPLRIKVLFAVVAILHGVLFLG